MIERIPVGKEYISPGRTIGEGEFSLIQSVAWIAGSIHTDKEYMKNSQFGERILVGPCVLAFVWGLEEKSGLWAEVRSSGFSPAGLLGIDNVRFRTPVRPGDTLTVHSEIVEARPSAKNPKRVIVRIGIKAFNQNSELIMECTRSSLVESRD